MMGRMGGMGGMRSLANSPDEKPKITRDMLMRVLAFAKPYRAKIALTLFLILCTTGISLVSPLILRDLIDHTIPNKDLQRLLLLALALLLLPVIRGGLNVLNRRLTSQVGEGVIYDLRRTLYNRLQRMSLRFFTNTKVGELMSRMNSDVVGAQNAISSTIVSIITQTIEGIAVLAVMISLEWRLTLISIVILPLFILASRQQGKRLRDIARQQMETNAQMNAMMHETLNIGGALLVKLFGRRHLEEQRFAERAGEVKSMGIRRSYIASIFGAIIGLISATGTALVFGVGGYLVIQDLFTVGTIVALGSYLGSLYGSLQSLANAPSEFAMSIVSFERVFEVIDLPEELPERAKPIRLGEVAGAIEFDDVTFQYETGDEVLLSDVHRYGSVDNVMATLSGRETEHEEISVGERSQARGKALEHVSFKVAAGQLVALVGPSGAGKTTMTYLIPRLYDPTKGRILIDGHDLRDVSLDSLAEQVGMVTQETYLFHDTIRTNLMYARLDANQAELEEACKAANIHHFISQLEEGYDTIVGERGYRLSGGEKQRIALARVILKNPRILVLDEATSSLDSESEALIQEALERVMADRTSIVIAHRLSTILSADLILVIDRGQVVERGTHSELHELGGVYAQLYDTQFRKGLMPESAV